MNQQTQLSVVQRMIGFEDIRIRKMTISDIEDFPSSHAPCAWLDGTFLLLVLLRKTVQLCNCTDTTDEVAAAKSSDFPGV